STPLKLASTETDGKSYGCALGTKSAYAGTSTSANGSSVDQDDTAAGALVGGTASAVSSPVFAPTLCTGPRYCSMFTPRPSALLSCVVVCAESAKALLYLLTRSIDLTAGSSGRGSVS